MAQISPETTPPVSCRRIFKMYRLTECKRVSFLDPALLEAERRSVGKAIPGTEVFLRTS